MDNGIKDGYFTGTKVPAGIRDLIPLLPTRGTLLSGASAATPGTIGKWAKDNSTKIGSRGQRLCHRHGTRTHAQTHGLGNAADRIRP